MAKKILWIDENPDQVVEIVEKIRDEGFIIDLVDSASHGAAMVAEASESFFLIIVDFLQYDESLLVPVGGEAKLLESPHGCPAGLTLARWIKRNYHDLHVIGVSIETNLDTPAVLWFNDKGAGYFDKYSMIRSTRALLNRIRFLSTSLPKPATLKTYIIHGQDDTTLSEVKKYLRNTFRITNPIVVREQSEHGKAVIENFDFRSPDFFAVFVLLTPVEKPCSANMSDKRKREGRQHLYFEMGFFYSLCQQGKGKLFFLHKEKLKLPENITGVHFIDIRNGMEACDKIVLREMAGHLPLPPQL